jgi:DNA-binding MarR family transcriptional regulator
MRQIGSILGCNVITSHSGRRYRRGAVFVMDARAHSTPLDRNQRAKLLAHAEGIERRTKAKGRRSGILGLSGLAVLRALVLQYNNGICNPSYSELQRRTGFCRQTIAKALHALEAVGLIRVVRRLVRRQINRAGVLIHSVVQGANLYSFSMDAQVQVRMLAAPCARSFPKANALISLLFNRVCQLGGTDRKGPPGKSKAGQSSAMLQCSHENVIDGGCR